MALDYDQLPAHLKRAVDEKEGRAVPAGRRVIRTDGQRWRCFVCKREFDHWGGKKGAETHSRNERHGRQECIVPVPE